MKKLPKLNIFIGLTHERPHVSDVCKESVLTYNPEARIFPMHPQHLAGWTRKRAPDQNTDHTIARFMCPAFCKFEGYSIFMDDDFIVECNLMETLRYINDMQAVSVVQHNYTPTKSKYIASGVKDEYNSAFPRKNWASFMLFNNGHPDCRKLTLSYVNNAPASDLMHFRWTETPFIGKMPIHYNFLVGEYNPIKNIKIYHYTLGGPWANETKSCDFAKKWLYYEKKLKKRLTLECA
jgi:hypothetical protein